MHRQLAEVFTFELSTLEQRSRFVQREKLLNRDKVVVYP